MPILYRDEAPVSECLQFAHEMRESYAHDGVDHHLVEHPGAKFGRILLFIQEVKDWVERGHRDQAKKYRVYQVLIINISLDQCPNRIFGHLI